MSADAEVARKIAGACLRASSGDRAFRCGFCAPCRIAPAITRAMASARIDAAMSERHRLAKKLRDAATYAGSWGDEARERVLNDAARIVSDEPPVASGAPQEPQG